MFFNQVAIESVVTGRHWSMRGEDHSSRNASHSLVERNTLVFHPHAHGFKYCKGAVAFVQVQNRRLHAHGAESPETADTEKQFLSNPHAAIASV
jgi:hypothetical protein